MYTCIHIIYICMCITHCVSPDRVSYVCFAHHLVTPSPCSFAGRLTSRLNADSSRSPRKGHKTGLGWAWNFMFSSGFVSAAENKMFLNLKHSLLENTFDLKAPNRIKLTLAPCMIRPKVCTQD